MGPTVIFSTTFSRYFPILCAAGAGVAIILMVIDAGASELVTSAPFLAAAVALVWALFWFPRVEVSDGGITVVNIVRTVHIPWPCFGSADARWTLSIDTAGGTVTSWAVPTGSGTARRLPKGRSETTQAEKQLGTGTAEAAALVIGERYAQLQRAGHLAASTIARPELTRTFNTAGVITIGAAVALIVIGVLAN